MALQITSHQPGAETNIDAALRTYVATANHLQSVRQKNQELSQQKEAFDIQKKKAKLELDGMEINNQITGLQRKSLDEMIKFKFGEQEKVIKAKQVLNENAEADLTQVNKESGEAVQNIAQNMAQQGMRLNPKWMVGLSNEPFIADEATKPVYSVDPNTGTVKNIGNVPEKAALYKTENTTRQTSLDEERMRRDARWKFNQLMTQGGGVNDEDLDEIGEGTLQDLRPQLEAGRGEPYIDKNGERQWRVLSEKEWAKKLEQNKFSPTEIEHIQTIAAEKRAWKNVLDRLDSLGINPETMSNKGAIEFTQVDTPIGVMSLPARFNLAGQFSKDPKYTAVKRDIELAFQAFRKRVTGAQASDKELARLRPIIASMADRPDVFWATVQNSIDNADIALKDRLNIYEMAGRDTSRFQSLLDDNMGAQGEPEEDMEQGGSEDDEVNALLEKYL